MIRRLVTVAAALVVVTAGSASAQPNASATAHASQQIAAHVTAVQTPLCDSNHYKNVNGICVHRPSSSPKGATAQCRDRSFSYSRHASGTCSHHGGVLRWIRHP